MEFFEVEFSDSFIAGNWLADQKVAPTLCKQLIRNAKNKETLQLGSKGDAYRKRH